MTDDRSLQDVRPAFRPVDWPAWWLWVAVCAASPVCMTFAAMAFNKTFNPADPNIVLIRTGTLAIIWIGLLAPPFLYWMALRRIAPRLNLVLWIGGLLLVGAGWLIVASYTPRSGSGAFDFIARARSQFHLAGMKAKIGGSLMSSAFFDLPWARLLLAAAVTAALMSLIPAWMVASVTHRRLHVFLIAAIFGACMAAVTEQLFSLFGYSRDFIRLNLNGRPWVERGNELLLMAASGAVWGAASASAFVMMSGPTAASSETTAPARPLRGAKALIVMGLAAVAIPVLAAFGVYLNGPQGLRAGAPELRKAFTSVSPERSEGETVLTFVQAADVTTHPQSTRFDFASDGRSGVVLNAQRELKLIDLATGRVIRQIGEPLDALERFTAAWSPDGRFFVVRGNGPKFAIPGRRYSGHETRIRLFALPDYRSAGEFVSGQECPNGYSQSVMFEPDSSGIWVACSKMYAPLAEDVLAIKLSVPGMQAEQRYRYGESAAGGSVRDLVLVGGRILAWQNGSGDHRFRLHDLTQMRPLLTLPDLRTPDLAGKLTPQDARTQIDETRIELLFCGLRTEAANTTPDTPATPAGSICRVLRFDARTGARLGSSDIADGRFVPNTLTRDFGRGLRIAARWQNDSKTGEMTVHDAATGRQRQRIVSVSQRPLGVSPDGRWLVSYAPDQKTMRIYRVSP